MRKMTLAFAKEYGYNRVFSQNGEEGIILECVERLGIVLGHAVEIGGNDGMFCSNTALLIRDHNWSGVFVEADSNLSDQCAVNWEHSGKVSSIHSNVTEENINQFVTDDTDVLSLDTDGHDYTLFAALKAKPPILIIEIDSSIPPDQRGFNSGGGASYLEMLLLAHQKGYFLLCHTGNMIFIRNDFQDLFPELKGTSALSDVDLYFNRSWLKEAA